MRVSPTIAVVALTMGLVGACAPPLLAPDDRDHVCQVAVYEKFGSPVFHPNPLSSPTGGLAGAAGGALQGLVAVPNVYAWIITVPLGAVIGAVGGTACAVASQSHPNAEADFEKILKTADAGNLKRALETELNTPRAGCGQAQPDASAATVPDTVHRNRECRHRDGLCLRKAGILACREVARHQDVRGQSAWRENDAMQARVLPGRR